MDMPGFSRSEQLRLAFLVRAHRRRFPLDVLATYPGEEAPVLVQMAILLRLAVVLRRNRSTEAPPLFQCDARGRELRLHFPSGFLREHPLTALDLSEEAASLKQAGYALAFTDDV